ncbi:FixH family protein [Riemerella columbina]|uniref:FixH family protein n=1 Tax=Riemerella columbina TaxID=103810 RepID=UPI000381A061|nr:FixH family protein [Riemerella columbina]
MKKFKFSWGHGVVVALASFIIFILYLIFVFSHGQQNSELVSDDYYEEELGYQKVIDAKNNAATLEQIPEYKLNTNGIKISFPKDINNQNSKVRFILYRVDDQRLDIKKDIQLNADNTFLIPSKVLVKGAYILKLMWTKDNKNYQVDYEVLWN